MKTHKSVVTEVKSPQLTQLVPTLLMVRDAVIDTLVQLDALLAEVPQALYVQNPAGAVKSAMGPHVRHALDHVNAWLAATSSGQLDYDQRARGTNIEHDPVAAQACMARLIDELKRLDAEQTPAVWRLMAQVSVGGPSLTFDTTPERELAFVLSHTIHHLAIIAIMARELGLTPPATFGYAPATRTYLADQARTATASR